MKEVIIRKMKLTNFKGLRDFSIEFNDSMTSILGKNGSGKTTIFDAFCWLLFGKDSQDRKIFNIKTLDSDGKAIPKIPHEVAAVLLVEGEEISLCRRYNEDWAKKRGSATEEFVGHKEERLYNDVPLSVKDWTEKINAICSEQVFKFISNPLYFSTQKTDIQRSMLFRMAGSINDADIAAGNEDFTALLANLTGKTMAEYKIEIQSKKRRIKAEIEGIPERIDERRRDEPEVEDWEELENNIKEKRIIIRQLEEQIADKTKANSVANEARLKLQQREFELRQKLLNRENEIKQLVQKGYNEQLAQQSKICLRLDSVQAELRRVNSELNRYQTEHQTMQNRRAILFEEWKNINARQLKFNEDEFVCPTCKRPLDIDDIEAKQAELTANFNSRKAADLAENERNGLQNKEAMIEVTKLCSKCNERIAELTAEIDELESNPLFTAKLTAPDTTDTLKMDAEYNQIIADLTALREELAKPTETADTLELGKQKIIVESEIDELRMRLSKKELIERNEARINELERQLREQSEELARLEGIEFTMAAFSKARIEAYENKINSMFSMVKFKMFDQQINGGEVETCEATLNGKPYSTCSNAERINIGLDIINAICKSEGVSAPIFIDNAEAVNKLIPTQSQLIRLVVTEDSNLKIE